MATLLTGCLGARYNEPTPTEELSLQAIHEVSLSKDQIFEGAREWMATTFVDSESVVRIQDKPAGKIMGNGVVDFHVPHTLRTVPCLFTVTVEIKDGKYRATYENFVGIIGSSRVPLSKRLHTDPAMAEIRRLDDNLFRYLKSTKEPQNW